MQIAELQAVGTPSPSIDHQHGVLHACKVQKFLAHEILCRIVPSAEAALALAT